jgi:hypothetical protein
VLKYCQIAQEKGILHKKNCEGKELIEERIFKKAIQIVEKCLRDK